MSQQKLVIGPNLLSVYFRRMARYAYVATTRDLLILPFKGAVSYSDARRDTRGKVSIWKKLTKIDLRSAYQKIVLDKASKQLCTINTHKGFFDIPN